MKVRYVIEKRDSEGALDFSDPQPEKVFGLKAIEGITEDEVAAVVLTLDPKVVLHGAEFYGWAALINPGFRTRMKMW